MKSSLIFVFILIYVSTIAQTPLTGLYKSIDGDSYLSIKEKKGRFDARLSDVRQFEGSIYEKNKNTLQLKGSSKNNKLTGTILLNVVVERHFEGILRGDTLDLTVKVPNDTAYSYISFSFKKVSQNPKINPDKIFGTDSEHPDELVGTWTHIDLQTKSQVGHTFQKNGTFQFIGYSLPKDVSIVNSTWYVRNGHFFYKFEIPGWNKPPHTQENLYKVTADTLSIDWDMRGINEVFYRKREEKK
jgi:hypothetical protein